MSLVVAGTGVVVAAACLRIGRRHASWRRATSLPGRPRPAQGATRDRPLEQAVARVLASSGFPLSGRDALRLWCAGTVATAFVGAGFLGPAGAAAGTVAAGVAGPVVAAAGRRRRQERLRAAVPHLLEEAARELRAGGTVGVALDRLALRDDAVGEHAREVAGRTTLGLRLTEALPRWAETGTGGAAVESVRVAAAGLEVAAGAGARSAAALDALAGGLRDADTVRAEVRAHGAQGRVSAWVLGLLPLGALAFSAVFDAGTTRLLFVHPLGRVCLVSGLLLEIAGVAWIRRIVRGPR